MKQRNRHLGRKDFEDSYGQDLAPYLEESTRLEKAAWRAVKRGDNPAEDPSVIERAVRIADIEKTLRIGPEPPSTPEAIIAGSLSVQIYLQEQSNNAGTSGIIV